MVLHEDTRMEVTFPGQVCCVFTLLPLTSVMCWSIYQKKRKPCANILVISTWDVIVPFLGTADNNYRAVNTSAGVGWGMDVHRRTDVHMDMPDIGSALQTLMSTFLQLLNWCGQTVLILKIVWWGIVLEKQLRSTIYNNLMQYFLLLWPQNNAGIHQFVGKLSKLPKALINKLTIGVWRHIALQMKINMNPHLNFCTKLQVEMFNF